MLSLHFMGSAKDARVRSSLMWTAIMEDHPHRTNLTRHIRHFSSDMQ